MKAILYPLFWGVISFVSSVIVLCIFIAIFLYFICIISNGVVIPHSSTEFFSIIPLSLFFTGFVTANSIRSKFIYRKLMMAAIVGFICLLITLLFSSAISTDVFKFILFAGGFSGICILGAYLHSKLK